MTAQQTIEQLKEEFDLVGGWEERYAHIIAMGRALAPYPEEFRTEEYRVKGCTSQVWLHPRFDGERLKFDADSDALIVKGLVAMLMRIFYNRTPYEILSIDPGFVKALGLDSHLSPSRANGLASMLKQIMRYAAVLESTATPPITERPHEDDEAVGASAVGASAGGRAAGGASAGGGAANAAAAETAAHEQAMSIARTEPVAHTVDVAAMRDKVIEGLHTVFDPEIPIDIYELGLIYEVRVAPNGDVHILMTLTTPNCPSAQSLPIEVEQVTRGLADVGDVEVEITFDPAWDRTMMSEAALFSIGLF